MVVAELGVSDAAEVNDELGHRFNVAGRGPEIDDAETQSIGSTDHGIGNESLTAPLNVCQQALIQLVQILFRLFGTKAGAKF